MTTTETGTITEIERLNCSVNGNPRYSVTYNRGDYDSVSRVTSPDISGAYEIGNPGYRVGSTVQFTLTRAGRISHLSTLEDTP